MPTLHQGWREAAGGRERWFLLGLPSMLGHTYCGPLRSRGPLRAPREPGPLGGSRLGPLLLRPSAAVQRRALRSAVDGHTAIHGSSVIIPLIGTASQSGSSNIRP
uniref:Uncharacterized protein n=1 Tax=Eutreptiella gymnastica TaxID=73025 RepID=A0A7S1J910_9EUGL